MKSYTIDVAATVATLLVFVALVLGSFTFLALAVLVLAAFEFSVVVRR